MKKAEETGAVNKEEVAEEKGLFETETNIVTPVNKEVVENKVVSQYFDMNNNAQVINKEHSSIVIRQKH